MTRVPTRAPVLALAGLLVLCGAMQAEAQIFPLRINEIRIDQPATDDDEYFELIGPPGFPLTPFSYLVIGEGAGGNPGVVEAVVPLVGQFIGPTGFFVVAEPTFTLGVPDFVAPLEFENGDNVTHLLVEGFFGFLGQDLDLNDDCMLDLTPWALIVDSIGVILEDNPPVTTECHYGPPTVGPDGTNVPGHVKRCPDETGAFEVAAFDLGIDDTPGGPNVCPTPVWAFGILHTPVGQASLQYSGGQLVVSNIGASGDDGFVIDAGDADGLYMHTAGHIELISFNGFIQDTRFDPDTGAEQIITFENIGTAIEIVADFSGVGASTRRIMILLDGQVVYDLPGHSGPWDFRVPGGIPAGAKCYTHGNPIYWVTEYEVAASTPVETPTGGVITGDRICFLPESPTVSSDTLSHLRVTAANIPELVLIDEAVLNFDELRVRALGEAHFETIASSHLLLGNIGASGDDGYDVETTGPGGRFEATLLPVVPPPAGASIDLRFEAEGTGSTTPMVGLLLFVLSTSGLVELTPNFAEVGGFTYTLVLELGGGEVFFQPGRTGVATRYTHFIGTSMQCAADTNLELEWTLAAPTPVQVVNGPTVLADRILVRPDGPSTPSLSWIVQRSWVTGIPAIDVLGFTVTPPPEPDFVRGDCNADGMGDIADGIFSLNVLFGGLIPDCHDACDANDDGAIDIADPIFVLTQLFAMGPNPPPPFPACGPDPTGDALDCPVFPPCP